MKKYSLFSLLVVLSWKILAQPVPMIFSPHNISKSGLKKSDKIVLTFDDGPSFSGGTESVLNSLKLYQNAGFNAVGTFFVTGRGAKGKNGLKALKRMYDEGHIIGNHTTEHPRLSDALYSRPEKLIKEILTIHKLIQPFLPNLNNLTKRWYFRAPFAAWASQRAETLNQHPELNSYIGPILWDVGGEFKESKDGSIYSAADWACWSKKVSVETCALGYLKEVQRKGGGVILLHDIHLETAEMLKYLLVTWTGKNLFKDNKYEKFLKMNKFDQVDIISLDDVKAYEEYDRRLNNL